MTYALEIERAGEILLVKATGTRSIQAILAMSKDILAACWERGLKKVLVDVVGLEGRLSTLDAYDIPDKHFPKMRDRRVITHCAIVDLKTHEESARFFETVALNRGFTVRLFSGAKEALDWLKK